MPLSDSMKKIYSKLTRPNWSFAPRACQSPYPINYINQNMGGVSSGAHVLHLVRSGFSLSWSFLSRALSPSIKQQATGLDAWASRVKCPSRFVSHLHEICIYIWVVYSLCFFCCLFITVTWWYVWCIVWVSGDQEEVQACSVTLWPLSYHATVYTKPLQIHIFINTQWIFMFNVSIWIIFLWENWLK